MRECIGIFLLCIAVVVGIIVILDLSWGERIGMFFGIAVFFGLVISVAYFTEG